MRAWSDDWPRRLHLTRPEDISVRNLSCGGHVRAADFYPDRQTAQVTVSRFGDCVFEAASASLRREGNLIAETAYLFAHDTLDLYTPDNILDLSNLGVLSIGYNRPSIGDNYYHWMTQSLPAIYSYCLAGNGQRPTIVLPQTISPLELRSLELAEIDANFIYVDAKTKVRTADAQYSNYLTGCADWAPSAVSAQLFERMRTNSLRTRKHNIRASRLYVARTDTTIRKMLNEDALIDLMRANGFSIVVASKMGIDPQIRMFSDADIVVGPHGAGLTNIAFCKPGCQIIELTQKHYHNPCMVTLSQMNSTKYWLQSFDVDEDLAKTANGHEQQWRVDLGTVKALLDEFLPRASAKQRRTFSVGSLWPARKR